MLRTVKSRQLYGFLVLTVLPMSFGVGYYLKERQDSKIILQTTTPNESESGAIVPPLIIEERIKMLKRQDAELAKERNDILEKLKRIRVRELSTSDISTK